MQNRSKSKSWSASPEVIVLASKEVDLDDFQAGNLTFGLVTNIMLD
jgi:hypothetical protein